MSVFIRYDVITLKKYKKHKKPRRKKNLNLNKVTHRRKWDCLILLNQPSLIEVHASVCVQIAGEQNFNDQKKIATNIDWTCGEF